MQRSVPHQIAALGLSALLAGCATPTPPRLSDSEAPQWQGRLSVTVHSTPPSSLHAGFVLQGLPTNGTLDLFSPLGTTVASLQWTPDTARLRHGGEPLSYGSMDELTEHATGSALPLAALFDWLQGQATPVTGWEVDLSQLGQGKLRARRTDPAPEVVLRLQLD